VKAVSRYVDAWQLMVQRSHVPRLYCVHYSAAPDAVSLSQVKSCAPLLQCMIWCTIMMFLSDIVTTDLETCIYTVRTREPCACIALATGLSTPLYPEAIARHLDITAPCTPRC
jgi:hypothetical protein